MENKIIDSKNICLAQLRYFNFERKSTVIPDEKAYVILLNVDGNYSNIVTGEVLPVYGRVPYANTTLDGEDYGTMLYSVTGEVKDGMCYLLEEKENFGMFVEKDSYSMKEIESEIINSSLLFVDRIDLLNKRKLSVINRLRANKIILKDTKKMENFYNSYCASEEKVIKK